MITRAINGKTPQIGANCFIAENAVLVGDVTYGQINVAFGTTPC